MEKDNNKNPFSEAEKLQEELSEVKEAEPDDLTEDKPSENTGKPGKKKIAKKIILGVLIALVLAITGLCIRFWHVVRMVVNWDNIMAFVNSRRYSKEDLEKQMADNKAKMEKIAKENPLIDIRGDLTEEELKALNSGEITKEQAKKIVKGDITLEEIRESKKGKDEESKTGSEEPAPGKDEEPSGPVQAEPKPSQTQEDTKTGANDRVSEIVSELYVIQADFISKLEAIGDQAYADYKATHYDRDQVMTIVDSYTATVGALEAECDRKVNSLIKELNAELDRIGEDRTLAKDIQKYYYTEKSLKKSYYLDKLDDEDYK